MALTLGVGNLVYAPHPVPPPRGDGGRKLAKHRDALMEKLQAPRVHNVGERFVLKRKEVFPSPLSGLSAHWSTEIVGKSLPY